MKYEDLVKTKEFENLKNIIIDKKKKENFNIFKVLKLENQEIRHSAFLAYLLDPNQNHYLGVKFLQAIMNKVGADIEIKDGDKKDIKVKTEHYIKECNEKKAIGKRIDILITAPKFVCVIENKYGTGEHDKQCQMYKKYIQEKYQDKKIKKVFIYLDIVKHDIENFKKGNPLEGYISLSYQDILDIFKQKNIINQINKDDKSIQNNIINQYIEILNEKYNFSQEIKDACNKVININNGKNIDDILKLLTTNSPNNNCSIDDCNVIYMLQDYVWIEVGKKANDITNKLATQISERFLLNRKWKYQDKQYSVFRYQKEITGNNDKYLAVRNALNIKGEGNSIGTCIVEKSSNGWKEISRTRCNLINRNDFFRKLIDNKLEEDKLIESFLTEYRENIENDICRFLS